MYPCIRKYCLSKLNKAIYPVSETLHSISHCFKLFLVRAESDEEFLNSIESLDQSNNHNLTSYNWISETLHKYVP